MCAVVNVVPVFPGNTEYWEYSLELCFFLINKIIQLLEIRSKNDLVPSFLLSSFNALWSIGPQPVLFIESDDAFASSRLIFVHPADSCVDDAAETGLQVVFFAVVLWGPDYCDAALFVVTFSREYYLVGGGVVSQLRHLASEINASCSQMDNLLIFA